MARTGGILSFLMIGAVIIGMLLSFVAREAPVLGAVAGILMLVAFVLWFVVMIAIKVNFAQNGFPRGGGVIWTIIALVIAIIVLAVVAAIAAGAQLQRAQSPDPMMVGRAMGVWAVIIGILMLAMQFFFLLLGVRMNEYSAIGGGVWKGAGIVLIIATSLGLLTTLLYVVALLAQALGLLIVAGILGLVGLLLWAVVWLLIGIGLIGDANRLAAGVR